MENIIKNTKEVYLKFFKLLNNNKDIVCFDIKNLEDLSRKHLFGLELKEKYGLNIDPKKITNLDYMNFNEYISIGWWGEAYNRTISAPDNYKQPKNELLCVINFPTRAYIFGSDYPTHIFQKFWEELKSYNPKYIDTSNSFLFFPISCAKNIFNDFQKIYKKYQEISKNDVKKRRIKQLEEKLNHLKKGNN